MDMNW